MLLSAAMDPRQASAQLESWRSSLSASIAPILLDARTQLVAAQSRPEPDEAIGRIEELVRATLEPVFLRADMALEGLQQAYGDWIGAQEEVSDAHSELQSRLSDGSSAMRDWVERKLNSLVAQARARELLPAQGAHPQQAQPRRFCTNCGAPVADLQQRRCTQCGAAL